MPQNAPNHKYYQLLICKKIKMPPYKNNLPFKKNYIKPPEQMIALNFFYLIKIWAIKISEHLILFQNTILFSLQTISPKTL